MDALYPTTIMVSENKKQKTTNRLSNIHEDTNNEDVLTMTFQENVLIENAYQEDVLPVTFQGNVVIEDAYKEDVLPVTFKENVTNENYKKYAKSAMHKTTNQEDVDAKTYMENVVVPGTVANSSSAYDGPDDPQHNCMMGKEGAKDNTKRIAVTAITSERGGRGA